MRLIFEVIIYFFIYSILGWICESIYCSIGNKKIINRGFLNGPICPIYGFRALIIIFVLGKYVYNTMQLFIYGIIVTSILEYITGYLLEKMFNATWWDYTNKKFNINGRVCLKNSILFGFMSIILIQVIHKNILNLVNIIPFLMLSFLVINSIALLLIDLSFTVSSINKLNKKVKSLDEIIKYFKNNNLNFDKFDEESLNKLSEKIKNDSTLKVVKIEEIKNKLLSIKNYSLSQRRVIKAFPNMKHKYNHDVLIKIKEIIKNKNH